MRVRLQLSCILALARARPLGRLAYKNVSGSHTWDCIPLMARGVLGVRSTVCARTLTNSGVWSSEHLKRAGVVVLPARGQAHRGRTRRRLGTTRSCFVPQVFRIF